MERNYGNLKVSVPTGEGESEPFCADEQSDMRLVECLKCKRKYQLCMRDEWSEPTKCILCPARVE